MFVLKTVHDVIRIPPTLLAVPTIQAAHAEIDQKYPNRVLIDVGLVIGRYGDCLRISHGVCVPGDGGTHHECTFRLIVFRPFVEEVCLGQVLKSSAEGIQVSLGFFQDVYIPAYWMLNPSRYEEGTGLWVWTPRYDDAIENNDSGERIQGNRVEPMEENSSFANEESGDRYEMPVGAEIRFKVKSIHFTQTTKTAKGMQATMTTTAHTHSHTVMGGVANDPTTMSGHPKTTSGDESLNGPVRQRSSSVSIDESQALPSTMHIVGSICEDGLGLTSWWTTADDVEPEGKDQEENRT